MGSLAFHALDIRSTEIVDVIKGVGGLTEARTSEIYLPDWEDVWRVFRSGEPAYVGGRRVENICIQSNVFSEAVWIKDNCTIVKDATGPNGVANSAWTVTDNATNDNHAIRRSSNIASDSEVKTLQFKVKQGTLRYCFISHRKAAGNPSSWGSVFDMQTGVFTTQGTQIDDQWANSLADGWWLISINHDESSASSQNISINACNGPLTSNVVYVGSGGTILVADAQAEHVSGQADMSPSEYQATTTVPVAKIYATDRSGVPLPDLPWLYGGPAGTNQVTESFDLADAAWTETGTSVAVLDAVGLRGEANGATTLTDDDGAAFESVAENITIPNDSNVNLLRVFITKDSDETRFAGINLRYSGGTGSLLRLDLNTATGASVERVTVGTVDHEVNDAGLWWEVLISVTNDTSGDVTAIITILPAIGTVIGTVNVAATGSCIVGNVELHLDKTIAQVRGSTLIFTSGSTVSVDSTDLSFDDANHDDTEGAYFFEFKNVGLDAVTDGGFVGVGASGRILYAQTAAGFRSFEGVNIAVGPAIIQDADDVEYKVALAYGSSFMRINTDDAWGVEVAFDGLYDNTQSKIRVLSLAVPTAPAPEGVMLMRNLRRYDMTYAEALIEIPNMMNGNFPFEGLGATKLSIPIGISIS